MKLKTSSHPDFIDGIGWTNAELRWINERIESARQEVYAICAKELERYGTVNGPAAAIRQLAADELAAARKE